MKRQLVWATLVFGATAASAAPQGPALKASVRGQGLESGPLGQIERVSVLPSTRSSLASIGMGDSLNLADWPIAPGERRTLTVARYDIYAADARIVRMEGDRAIEVPRSPLRFFRGHAEGDPSVRALVVLDPRTGRVTGHTASSLGTHELLPPERDGALQTLNRVPVLFPDEGVGVACSADRTGGAPLDRRADSAPTTLSFLHTAVVAVDTDNELLLNNFGDSTTAATDFLAELFASVNVVYERDLSVRLLQGFTVLRPSSSPDPYVEVDPIAVQNSEFITHWRNTYGAVPRALAIMLSGKTGAGAGWAGLRSLCNKDGAYNTNRIAKGSTGAIAVPLVGHEIGHTFGSPHTHCDPYLSSGTPIDQCSNAEPFCYQGPTSCPAPATYSGIPNVRGTIMSYCNRLGPGCPVTSVFHPRTIEALTPAIQAAASGADACLVPLPGQISIGDVTVSEGNSGQVNASFAVTLSSAATSPVTVQYATSQESSGNFATAGSDFTTSSGTLTFAIGESSKTINVPVLGDSRFEPSETFVVDLSNATGASIFDGQGKATIFNDDSRAQQIWHGFFAVDTLETPYVGDFNGDNKTDIITFTRQNPSAIGDVYVALSDGTKFGTNTKWHDFFAITTDEVVVIGDYNGDGKDDIATWLTKTSRQVYVALSTGSGMLAESAWVSSIGADATDLLFSGDANGDGKDDLIAFARKEGKVYVAVSDGTKFGAPTVWHGFFAVSTYERPRVGDVNGDGKADIVTFATDSPTAFGDVYVATSDGARFVGPTGAPNDSSKWHDFFAIRPSEEVRVGDLNKDGRQDFFTFLPHPFAQCYSVNSLGTAMGPNVLWPQEVAQLSSDTKYVGDVNGGGKADIIVFDQNEGKVYISLAP